MRIGITHVTRLDYNADVVEAVMDVRLGPISDDHQRWIRHSLRADPVAAIRRYTDGFGNPSHLITIPRAHRHVEIVSAGDVVTLLRDPFAPPAVPPAPLDPIEEADYCYPSPLIALSADLAQLAEPFRPGRPSETFAAVRELMGWIYQEFTYQTDVTSVTTTVPEVLAGRQGVCQDFAHVLIGLCRAIGIPTRYVSGYIVTEPSGQSQDAGRPGRSQSQGGPSRGAGASHAWIEAYTPTHGWRGFDPTNNLVASDHHVKMAIGRDYGDVPPTRGSFRGTAAERLQVRVMTEKLDDRPA